MTGNFSGQHSRVGRRRVRGYERQSNGGICLKRKSAQHFDVRVTTADEQNADGLRRHADSMRSIMDPTMLSRRSCATTTVQNSGTLVHLTGRAPISFMLPDTFRYP